MKVVVQFLDLAFWATFYQRPKYYSWSKHLCVSCYGLNACVPPKSYIKTLPLLPENMTILGGEVFWR